MKTLRMIGSAIGFLALCGAGASAGTITGVNNGYDYGDGKYVVEGQGGNAGVVLFNNPVNNDNVTENGAFPDILIVKEFTSTDAIDIEFIGEPSQGTTEYWVVEAVFNNSGEDWPGYELLLGSGVEDEFTGGWSIADFDWPTADPAPSAEAYASMAHLPYSINFWNGVVLDGDDYFNIQFGLDVPDFECAECFTFTLREQPADAPIVPEPISFALFGLGGLAMALPRKRTRSS